MCVCMCVYCAYLCKCVCVYECVQEYVGVCACVFVCVRFLRVYVCVLHGTLHHSVPTTRPQGRKGVSPWSVRDTAVCVLMHACLFLNTPKHRMRSMCDKAIHANMKDFCTFACMNLLCKHCKRCVLVGQSSLLKVFFGL